MLIGMDMRAHGSYSGGIGRYHENLFREVKNIDKNNSYIPMNLDREGTHKERVYSKTNRYIKRKLFSRFLLEQLGIQLFHTSFYDFPHSTQTSLVLTIHDLAYIRFPNILPKYLVSYLTTMSIRAAKQVNSIIAVSKSTKDDICELLRVDEKKVDVVYEGVNHLTNSYASGEEFVGGALAGQGYILFVGTIEPRKNLVNLARAFQRIASKKDSGVSLVIAGKLGYQGKEIVKEIRKLGLPSGSLLFTGYINEEELVHLYRNAKMFVMPSIYEGFGIPVVEAMVHGCPVVCSGVSSLPEIVGKAGVYFNPNDIEEMAEVMIQTLESQETLMQLANLGRDRSKQFSWKKAAEDTISIYNRFS